MALPPCSKFFTKAWRTAPAPQPTKPTAAMLQHANLATVRDETNAQSEQKATLFRKPWPPVCPLVLLHSGQQRTYVSRLWLSSLANKRIIIFNVSALTGAKAGNLCTIFSGGDDQGRQRVAAMALA